VRVLAARFPDRQRASAALEGLRRRLRLAADDVAIAPMGTPGENDTGDETVLAGHFNENQTSVVRSLVSESGGEVVADVDEQWTGPRVESSAAPVPAPPPRAARPPPGNSRRREGRAALADSPVGRASR
jgi:hypothetical protein